MCPNAPKSVLKYPKPDYWCYSICCSGFIRTEELTNMPEPNLSNDIHDLYRRENFAGCSEIDYDSLDQPLRLATLLVEASLAFWYTIFFGNLRQIGPKDFEFFDEIKLEDLTEERKEATRIKLRELTAYIQIELNTKRGTGSETVPIRAARNAFFRGGCSKISIERDLYDNVVEGNKPGADAVFRDASNHAMARTIVHETVHAAVIARHQVAVFNANFFFEGSQIAEEGYEWEKRTFGGHLRRTCPSNRYTHDYCALQQPREHSKGIDFYNVDGVPTQFEGMIVLEEYPNKAILDHCERKGEAIIAGRGRLSDVHLLWHVPFMRIHRMFRMDFWQNEVVLQGIKALQFLQETAYRFELCEDGGSRPHNSIVVQDKLVLFDHHGIPNGYGALANGLIKPAHAPEFTTERSKHEVFIAEPSFEVLHEVDEGYLDDDQKADNLRWLSYVPKETLKGGISKPAPVSKSSLSPAKHQPPSEITTVRTPEFLPMVDVPDEDLEAALILQTMSEGLG